MTAPFKSTVANVDGITRLVKAVVGVGAALVLAGIVWLTFRGDPIPTPGQGAFAEAANSSDARIKTELDTAGQTAAEIALEDPQSTVPYTLAALEAAGWRRDSTTAWTITGSPAANDFCISAYNPSSTATVETAEWKYTNGTLTKGPRCLPTV